MTTALDEVKLALAADPTLGEAYNLRGLIYASLGDDGLAEDSFQARACSSTRATPTRCTTTAGTCASRSATPRRTRCSTRRWPMPQYRDAARTLLAKGVCQARAGQLAEAERALLRAYELDPANPSIAVNLAEVLFRRGEYERARFYIRRVNALPAVTERADAVAGRAHRARARAIVPGAQRARRPAAQPLPGVARGGAFERASSMSEPTAAATAAPPGARDHRGRPAARGAPGAGPAHRRAGRVDQGHAAQARSARSRPLRRTARRDLHPRAGARPSAAA